MQDEPDERVGGQPLRNEPVYETFVLTWKGQALTLRWCVQWLGNETAHLEIVTDDRRPHPISETGYRSHFTHRGGSADLNSFQAFRKWFSALVMPPPLRASAG